MTRLLFALLVGIPFTAYSVYALNDAGGYLPFLWLALDSAPGIQVFADLAIALGIVFAWMWRDAEDRGRSALPWIVFALGFGSLGPLGYLLLTGIDDVRGKPA